MSEIDSIINKLTLEEKELHSDLIEECMQREMNIIQTETQQNQNKERLFKACTKMADDLHEIERVSHELKKTFKKTETSILKMTLALIPEDKFLKA